MKCNELVRLLETVKPGLAGQTILPFMTHFWFLGDRLRTFNETIGMEMPCKTDFIGAAPPHLLELLKVSKSEMEVEMVQIKRGLEVSVGSSRTAKFSFIDLADFIDNFDMPKLKDKNAAVPAKLADFRKALKCCLLSVGTDTSRPDLRGVTLIPKGDKLLLFSTNNSGFTRCELPLASTGSLKSRVVLPRAFCDIFLDLTSDDQKGIAFEITKAHALAVIGDVTLFGKLPDVEQPTDFEDIFAYHFDDKAADRMIPIPKRLEALVDRSLVVTDADVDQERSELTVKDGELIFYSKSKRGEVDDVIQLNDEKKKIYHDDVGPIKIYAQFLKVGLSNYTEMAITKRCVVMAQGERIYLISAS